MAKIILGMALSLDGYSNDRHGSVEPLYPDFEAMHAHEVMQESIRTTGAVVMGRRSYDMSPDPDWFAGQYEYQVPLFILTHRPPARHPKEGGGLTITFVTDGVVSALTQAKAAAGDRDVNTPALAAGASVIGADTAQQCLRSDLVDEIQVDLIPILLGGGLRPLDNLGPEPIKLERLAVQDWPGGGTHLRFRVVK